MPIPYYIPASNQAAGLSVDLINMRE